MNLHIIDGGCPASFSSPLSPLAQCDACHTLLPLTALSGLRSDLEALFRSRAFESDLVWYLGPDWKAKVFIDLQTTSYLQPDRLPPTPLLTLTYFPHEGATDTAYHGIRGTPQEAVGGTTRFTTRPCLYPGRRGLLSGQTACMLCAWDVSSCEGEPEEAFGLWMDLAPLKCGWTCPRVFHT